MQASAGSSLLGSRCVAVKLSITCTGCAELTESNRPEVRKLVSFLKDAYMTRIDMDYDVPIRVKTCGNWVSEGMVTGRRRGRPSLRQRGKEFDVGSRIPPKTRGVFHVSSPHLLVSLSFIIRSFVRSLTQSSFLCFSLSLPLVKQVILPGWFGKLTSRLHSATGLFALKSSSFLFGPCNTLLHVDTITTSHFEKPKVVI